jgi:hypothetical protein
MLDRWAVATGRQPCDTFSSEVGGFMKTVTKAVLVLLVTGVALLASQEGPRVYVEHCFCNICSYFFGE